MILCFPCHKCNKILQFKKFNTASSFMKLKSILSSLKSELSLSRLSTIAPTIRSFAAEKSAETTEESSGDLAHRRFLFRPPTMVRWGTLEIREELGQGAFGTVYRAWDPVLRRDVALKLFLVDQGARLKKLESWHW